MHGKVLVRIRKIWNDCYESEINAIARENVDTLIKRVYLDFSNLIIQIYMEIIINLFT